MKKTLSIIIAFIASLQFAYSQNTVTINDTNFLAALISDGVDTNNDGIIQTSEAQAKTALYLSNDNINDASGIEAFTNLELLFISNNNLTELDVTKNVNLTYLNFSVNNISAIDLSKNTKLQTLLCASTHVLTNLDLSQNKSLTSLECTGNKITSFDLSNNPELTVLHCADNLMTKIDLRNNHKVKEVWAYYDVPNLKMICLSTESMLLLKNDGSPFMGNGKFIWSETCVSSSPQTISFTTPSKIKYGTQNYTLAATSSSGLPITYTSSNTSIATISNNVVTTLGVGTVTITASQAGNADFDKATDVTQLLEIVKETSVISFDKLPNILFGTPTLQLNSTSNNTQTNIVYESLNPEIATVSGNVVTILKVGTAEIKASQVGNANYVVAKSITQPLVVYAFQIITFDTIPTKTINDKSFVIQASTSSGLPLTYESTNKAVATVNGNIVTIFGIGETDIVVSQDGNDNYFGASVSQKLKVTQATAINEVNIENIEIFPNPSNGIIHVSNNQYFTDLKISNLNAETVFTSTLNESSFQSFDINSLPAGIYVIELSNGIAQQKSKLVICD